MIKPIVVLADLDANYLVPLEDKLTEELYDQIDLEVITTKSYLDSYFSTPRKIDTLIISKELFSQDLFRHNVTDVFVLTEDIADKVSGESVTSIYKYSSTKEIFNYILYKNKEILDVQFSHKETQIIALTSPIGGSGCTTLAMALSESLARIHKRVLFISMDSTQSFSYYLQDKNSLPNDISRVLGCVDDKLYKSIKPYFRKEGFTYLPPLSRTLSLLGLEADIYVRIIDAVKLAKDFDYIIIDSPVHFEQCSTEIIQNADKVILNVLQDDFSVHKTEFFIKNIDCKDSEKFIFVCNKFRRDINNEYLSPQFSQQFYITEYIDEVPQHRKHKLDSFVEQNGVKNLLYLFS